MKTITRIFKKAELSNKGNFMMRLSIQVAEMPNIWIGGFVDTISKNWQVGTQLDDSLFTQEAGQYGKTYHNFNAGGDYIDWNKVPLTIGVFMDLVKAGILGNQVNKAPQNNAPAQNTQAPANNQASAPAQAPAQNTQANTNTYPTDDINPEDIPF